MQNGITNVAADAYSSVANTIAPTTSWLSRPKYLAKKSLNNEG